MIKIDNAEQTLKDMQKAAKDYEYRELVKQYAGQIVSLLPALLNHDYTYDYSNVVRQAHSLARDVLASLETEGGK